MAPAPEQSWRSSRVSVPAEVTYNSLIAACQRGSLWQCALAVLKDLESTLQSSVPDLEGALLFNVFSLCQTFDSLT